MDEKNQDPLASKTEEHEHQQPNLSHSYSLPDLNHRIYEIADKFVTFQRQNSINSSRSTSYESSTIPPPPSMQTNTRFCMHRHSCLENAVFRGILRTYAAAYVTNTTWSLVSSIIKILIQRKALSLTEWKSLFKSTYSNPIATRFAQCLALLSFLYKFILCFIFRRGIHKLLFSNKHYHYYIPKFVYPALSAFIASFVSMHLIPTKSLRNTIALFLIVRSIADLIRVLHRLHYVPKVPNFEIIVFTLFQMPIMYSFMHDPSLMNRTYYKWILKMGNLHEYQVDMLRKMMKYKDGYPLLSCSPIFHEDPNCLRAHSVDWVKGLGRAAMIYIPVHFIPFLLLTPKKILKSPMKYIRKKSWNTLRSSMFLTSYQYNMKMTECFGRKWMNTDRFYIPMSGGITAGLALILEHPSRRAEIVLYVLPRALDVILNCVTPENTSQVFYDLLIENRTTPVLFISVSLMLWMAIRQCDGVIPFDNVTESQMNIMNNRHENICNRLNMTALSVIFGRFH